MGPQPPAGLSKGFRISKGFRKIRGGTTTQCDYNLERRYVIGILQAPATIEFDTVHNPAVDCKVAATPPAA